MRKYLIWLLIMALVVLPTWAETNEAKSVNFWQEFDITFWQTFPFATFWCYTIGLQFGPINWNNVLALSALISAGNAYFHARKVSTH